MSQYKRHNAIEWGKKQWDAAVEEICSKYDHYGGADELDMDEVRTIMTDLNSGRPPMPRDLLWVMAAGDKDGGGTLNKFEIRRILIKFRPHLRQQGGLVSLIVKYDPEGKGNISDHNFRLLLQDVTGASADMITAKDIARVRQAGGDRQQVIANFNFADKKGSEGGGKQVHLDSMASAIDQWADERNLCAEMLEKMKAEKRAQKSAGAAGQSQRASSATDFWSSWMCCVNDRGDMPRVVVMGGSGQSNRRGGARVLAYGNPSESSADPYGDGFVRPYFQNQSSGTSTRGVYTR